MQDLTRPILDRLPRYYHYVQDRLERHGQSTLSSSGLATMLGVDDTLVRRDLAAIGVKGQPKIGYHGEDVLARIRAVLGFEVENHAIIVGAGRLGQAIAAYPGFQSYGLRIVGAYDIAPDRIGLQVGEVVVESVDALEAGLATQHVEIAILTVPAHVVDALAHRLVDAGVPAFWNFAPAHLDLPPHVTVRNELLSVGLAEISYRLRRGNTPPQPHE